MSIYMHVLSHSWEAIMRPGVAEQNRVHAKPFEEILFEGSTVAGAGELHLKTVC